MKRITDVFISVIALIILFPLLLVVAIIIKIESKGKILFVQNRVGLNKRIFKMYKFRTMVDNAEALKKDLMSKNEVDGPVFKMKKDPRVTKFGAFFRKTSIDELPQLFNVLKGEMSIVGPRPPIPEEVEKYERWQLRRLSMRPGITCIWQVTGRNKISFEEWMELDLEYIDNWSYAGDIVLIMQTIPVIFKRTGL